MTRTELGKPGEKRIAIMFAPLEITEDKTLEVCDITTVRTHTIALRDHIHSSFIRCGIAQVENIHLMTCLQKLYLRHSQTKY